MIEHNGTTIVPDPRPDLKYDSQDWTVLLTVAHAVDPMLGGTLHGFRCGGLRLHRGPQGYTLRPEFDPTTSIWKNENEYMRDREKWLVPHGDMIIKCLDTLDKQHEVRRLSA